VGGRKPRLSRIWMESVRRPFVKCSSCLSLSLPVTRSIKISAPANSFYYISEPTLRLRPFTQTLNTNCFFPRSYIRFLRYLRYLRGPRHMSYKFSRRPSISPRLHFVNAATCNCIKYPQLANCTINNYRIMRWENYPSTRVPHRLSVRYFIPR
jgi:hypothetical protein